MRKNLKIYLKKERTSEKCRGNTYREDLFLNSSWLFKMNGDDFFRKKKENLKKLKLDHPDLFLENMISNNNKVEESEIDQRLIKINNIEHEHEHEYLNNILKKFNKYWSIDNISGLSSFKKRVQVLFYGLDELEDNSIVDLAPLSLLESSNDILGKMIGSMKLKTGEFVRIPILSANNDKNAARELIDLIKYFKPRIVLSLGMKATSILAERKMKLSINHGKFFDKEYIHNKEKLIIRYFPIFHPKLLEINQSMKRTTWNDLKEVLLFLKE